MVPSHRAHPAGTLATAPDHMMIPPVGMTLVGAVRFTEPLDMVMYVAESTNSSLPGKLRRVAPAAPSLDTLSTPALSSSWNSRAPSARVVT